MSVYFKVQIMYGCAAAQSRDIGTTADQEFAYCKFRLMESLILGSSILHVLVMWRYRGKSFEHTTKFDSLVDRPCLSRCLSTLNTRMQQLLLATWSQLPNILKNHKIMGPCAIIIKFKAWLWLSGTICRVNYYFLHERLICSHN